MVGELYKSSMGWAIRYPIGDNNKEFAFNVTYIPIENQSDIKDHHKGMVVPFSIKVKNSKNSKGNMPYAEIELN